MVLIGRREELLDKGGWRDSNYDEDLELVSRAFVVDPRVICLHICSITDNYGSVLPAYLYWF